MTLKMEQKWTVEGTERHEFKMSPGETATTNGRPPASTSNAAILAFNGGVSAFKAKDYATARAKFEEALSYDPYMRLAWAALGQVHLEQKRYREAAEAADKAVALGSTDESVLRSRWEAYRNLGDEAKAAKAREDLEKFGRLTEEAKRIHNEGVALVEGRRRCGRLREVQGSGRDRSQPGAGAARPRHHRPQDRPCGRGLRGCGGHPEGLHPQHAEALKIRYNAALKLGDEAKLADALRGLAAVDAATARNGLFTLATAAFQRDDVARPRRDSATCSRSIRATRRPTTTLGLILMREGAKQEAKSHLERFLELAPDDPDAATARDALTQLK